jgi:hypothetical protein
VELGLSIRTGSVTRPVWNSKETRKKTTWIGGRTFPLLFRCFAEKIPLQADLIPLFGRVAEFASDPNKINRLQGRIQPGMGLNGPFLLFFPV